MNILWIILVVLTIIILFLVFFFWAIGKGLDNKFGPEWIPVELGIQFNHINVYSEDKETIKYLLTENETLDIEEQITDNLKYNLFDGTEKSRSGLWTNPRDKVYSFKESSNNKLKAELSVKKKTLIYYR